MTSRRYSALFLCTGNSARSILAEAILERVGQGRFHAFSAGSQPKGQVHPVALEVLRERGHDTSNHRSKNWDEFALATAPEIDFIFTVCDNAAGESCPVWPGQPITAHWGVDDPAAFDGPRAEQRRVFVRAYEELEQRIEAFTQLSFDTLDRLSLQARLDEIGHRTTPATGKGS